MCVWCVTFLSCRFLVWWVFVCVCGKTVNAGSTTKANGGKGGAVVCVCVGCCCCFLLLLFFCKVVFDTRVKQGGAEEVGEHVVKWRGTVQPTIGKNWGWGRRGGGGVGKEAKEKRKRKKNMNKVERIQCTQCVGVRGHRNPKHFGGWGGGVGGGRSWEVVGMGNGEREKERGEFAGGIKRQRAYSSLILAHDNKQQ